MMNCRSLEGSARSSISSSRVFLLKSLRKAESVTALFQRADGFLKGFLIVLPDAHDFADSPHLGPELVQWPREFFKIPAGKFDHDIIAGRGIFVQGAVPPVGDLIQREPARPGATR